MSLRRLATAVATLTLAFTASTTTAYALWSTTGSATFTVTLHTPPATVPDAPTGLACTLKQTGKDAPWRVEVHWNGPNNIDYRVYRVGVPAPVRTTKTTKTGQMDATAFGTDTGATYSVTVRALVGGVESLDSEVLTFSFTSGGCG